VLDYFFFLSKIFFSYPSKTTSFNVADFIFFNQKLNANEKNHSPVSCAATTRAGAKQKFN
jgi:hypothetical protein